MPTPIILALDTRQPKLTTVRVSDQVCEAEKEDDSGHALNLKGETAENNGLLTRPVLPVPSTSRWRGYLC